MSCRPFLRWPGGKRALVARLVGRFPERIAEYHEPFVGGGAVFFALHERIGRAVLSDVNAELIQTYRVVRDDCPRLMEAVQHHLRTWLASPAGTYYYEVRDRLPTDPLAVAARMVFLNAAGFNGLYRVNRAGRFNVAEGSRKEICQTKLARLADASIALRNAEIERRSFEATAPGPGAVVYADPPYDGGFTEYSAGGFGSGDQQKLALCADRWREAGASVVLSNRETPFIRAAYRGWRIAAVRVRHRIAQHEAERGPADEVVISSC